MPIQNIEMIIENIVLELPRLHATMACSKWQSDWYISKILILLWPNTSSKAVQFEIVQKSLGFKQVYKHISQLILNTSKSLIWFRFKYKFILGVFQNLALDSTPVSSPHIKAFPRDHPTILYYQLKFQCADKVQKCFQGKQKYGLEKVFASDCILRQHRKTPETYWTSTKTHIVRRKSWIRICPIPMHSGWGSYVNHTVIIP